MTSIPGVKLVVGDADVLIALISEDDTLHKRAVSVNSFLLASKINIIFPNTAVAEAITSFQRKLSKPKHALFLKDQYLNGVFRVLYVNKKITELAAKLCNPYGSKKNTFFDAIVAATAKKINGDAIFSFDRWYKKLGFKLVEDLEDFRDNLIAKKQEDNAKQEGISLEKLSKKYKLK